MSKALTSALIGLLALSASACSKSDPPKQQRRAATRPARPPRPPVEIPADALTPVHWQGVALHAGDRVRLRKPAGVFKAEHTGSVDITASAGHEGTMLSGEKRKGPPRWTPDEPITRIRVLWDAQSWPSPLQGEKVQLEAFEATVHVELLDVVQ